MTLNRILIIAILCGSTTLVACGDDGTVENTTDAGTTTTTDIPTPEHECGYDKECEGTFSDLTPCEDAVCDGGTCVKVTRSTWASCDHPDAGLCEGGYCNETGQCVLRTADDGAPCNESDWTACTIGECKSGSCVDVPTVVCDDNNPCTDDACDAETGACSSTPNTQLCDDGNPCTGGDVCADGACAGTEINAVTEDGDICTCTTDEECVIYDDGDLCNGVWGCIEGSCAEIADSAVTCDDKVDNGGCRTNACNPGTGACEMTPVANYEACDDGDSCTGCAPGVDCDNEGDYCQGGVCQPGNGAPCADCTSEADCAFLDDGDMCNGIWSCQMFVGEASGTCQPVPNSVVTCEANESDCTTSACEPTTGECVDSAVSCEAPPADSCDGLNATTYALVGVCAETEDDSDPCTYEATVTDCDLPQDTQCVTTLTGDACDDDTPCADEAETCTEGVCVATVEAQTWAYAPSCQGGVCGYDETITLCSAGKADGCVGLNVTAFEPTGSCNAEGSACAYTETVVEDCDVPKASECVGANGLAEVRSYAPTCDEDGCGHEMTATLCEQAATCEGDVLTSYDASCNEAGDACGDFSPVETDCAANGQVCVDGACADPCVPATECAAGACGEVSDGCTGTLTCGDCAEGEVCTEGMCEAAQVELAPNGCPLDCEGCFDGDTCTTTAEWWTCGEAQVCGFAQVELHVDMNNYGADSAPNFQGEFNGWCGDCSNTGTDDDMDGIYTFTQYLSPQTWQWKPSIGSWEVISSAPAECQFDAENSNYFFEVTEADVNSGEVVAVGPVCFADGFGTCGACAAPEVCDPACGEGEVCEGGVCVSSEPTFDANGCPSDCMGCFDGETCTTTSAWWECGESTVCGWAHVEINVDMNNYDAAQAPNFNGEFNEWCGECFNTGTDADMDGIYTFTQYLSPKTWQWKPAVGNWSVISSAPAECQFDAENGNYFFDVAEADVNSGAVVTVGPVCFADGVGTCGACVSECTPATECDEGMTCGTMDDGCGGTIECGTCDAGQNCNAGVCELGNIAEVAAANGSFTSLLTALTAAGLADTIADGGPFTVFAPTDDAFAASLEALGTTLEALAEDTDALSDILLYHVVEGLVPAADVVTLESAMTLQGSEVSIEGINEGVVLNGSVNVTATDVMASNGIIHVIDAVLLPPAECVPATECTEGMNCGTMDDGCGGTIACGTCGEGESCEANMCMTVSDNCSDTLFISEYVEGGGSNKVLELYNNTGVEVDMSTYVLWQGNNGGAFEAPGLALEGTVAAGETFVICRDGVDIFDAATVCDQTTNSSIMNFNGNDAMALVLDGVIVDQIGTEGVDPGSDGWAAGGEEGQGKDHTLVRVSSVNAGSTDWDATSATEWTVLPKDSGEGIGSHTIDAMCAAECTPATQCTEGMTCGTMDDGCGGTIACGTCGEGQSCNANMCEDDAPATMCLMDYAGCTEEDFAANDMTAMEGTIDINMVNFAPYSPTCVRVAIGQTVTIGAMPSHPFEKVCAEDDVMDSQDGSTEMVSFTFSTPGYYNYKCQFHGSMVGNIHVVP